MSQAVKARPRVLILGAVEDSLEPVIEELQPHCELVVAEDVPDALRRLRDETFRGVCVLSRDMAPAGFLLEVGGVLAKLPDGVALLDVDGRIVWSNARLAELAGTNRSLAGVEFFEAFQNPEIIGPDFAPLHTALALGTPAVTTFKRGDKVFLELDASPIDQAEDGLPEYLLIVVRDRSKEVLQRHKLNAIYQAGLELGDLQPQEISDLSEEDRVELLKHKILQFTKDLLEFETVEIRLLNRDTGELKPLLSVGMQPEASHRVLFASSEKNGVTGFVAATGRSYLCEDTSRDSLFLPGAFDTKSSLTVPLILHDETLGTFNVESPRTGAFSQDDLQFLELFCREVAIALNTLDLLAAEKASTAAESAQQLAADTACPTDEVLNDAAWLLAQPSTSPEAAERLLRIVNQVRGVCRSIHGTGEQLVDGPKPADGDRAALIGKRVLIVDAEADNRKAGHQLLGPHGSIVETARSAEEALLMLKAFTYDVIIADIRLPDMSGSQMFAKIRDRGDLTPIILMAGFGYDASHSLVRGRQMGMKFAIFKPFRREQLVNAVEQSVNPKAEPAAATMPA
ncbi:Regulator of RpoS [Caulifigura coniformis]|uniref:Regulator of RpoS n=1 Tax=Caulifigura coniformis TaxID=2527983 RepID=A0A517SCX9_9PLAN|nr:response regulator [Caulifigura coniformis]QDT53966.1 Regulator of RpoS [Caulifigura coniformis]